MRTWMQMTALGLVLAVAACNQPVPTAMTEATTQTIAWREGDVDAAAVGQVAHALGGIGGLRVDDVGRADAARHLQLVLVDVDRDHLRRPEGLRDLNDVEADAAGGDDRDALASTQIGAVTDRAVGGEDRAAQY